MLDALERISDRVPVPDEEYIGTDGFHYCCKCGKKTETDIELYGFRRRVRCICECKKQERAEREAREVKDAQDTRRSVCFSETNMAAWTFENDDRRNAKLSDAMRRYADDFEYYKAQSKGLLLYGNVGTGKTYYAAAIANALINKGYSVLMTNFARLANKIQSSFEGRQEYIDSLNEYSLLVIDDLGAERKSEYMQEIVFSIIDARYRSGKPFIVTTNLTADEFKKSQDIGSQRIYDRLFERCIPISVSGTSRRRDFLKESHNDDVRRLFSGDVS